MRERDIERALVKRVRQLKGEVRKVKWIGRRGAPDRLVMLPRRSFWAELKAPGARVPGYQLREHVRMRQKGMDVYVIDSIEAIQGLLA